MRAHRGRGNCLRRQAERQPTPEQSTSLRDFAPSREANEVEICEPVRHSADNPEYLGENHELVPVKTVEQQMGDQLTDQYRRATEGMRAVVKFGAMLMQVREMIANNSTRGIVRTGGADSKDTGLKAWLAQFAPTVPPATAWRFMSVAEAVHESFKLPAKVEKQLGFPGFVTAAPDQLPPELQAKQLELWSAIDGTSQRSWLDKLRPKRKGGDNTPRNEDGTRQTSELTPEQAIAHLTGETRDFFHEVMNGQAVSKNLWRLLTDDELRALKVALQDTACHIEQWLKTPQRDRAQFALSELPAE